MCRDCFHKLDKCPFCRKDYSIHNSYFSSYSNTSGSPEENVIRSNVSEYLIPANEYFWLSDREIERRLMRSYTALSGVFTANTLNRQDTARARRNWNYWFHYFNGRELLRPYHYGGYIFNHDIIHQCLNTGSFNDPNRAGVCADSQEARRFVKNQLETFFRNNQ